MPLCELGASVGRDFSLYKKGRHQIRSEVSSGLGYSSDSDFHNIRVDADLRYQYHRESQGDQRYAREFGQEELNSRGRLDLQHKVGVGFELRF